MIRGDGDKQFYGLIQENEHTQAPTHTDTHINTHTLTYAHTNIQTSIH